MKQRFLFIDGDSKYYDGVKHKTLFKDGDEYSAYWTNGKKVTTCTTNAQDDETAELELKMALVDYWLKYDDKARVRATASAIPHATTTELADLIDRAQKEIMRREGWNSEAKCLPLRKNVCRAKDLW